MNGFYSCAYIVKFSRRGGCFLFGRGQPLQFISRRCPVYFCCKNLPCFSSAIANSVNTLKHLKNCCLSRSGGGESSAKAKNECVQPVSDIAVHLDKSAEPKLILAKVKNETPIKSNASSMSPGNPKTELPGHSPAAGTKQSSAGTILARAQICPTFV